MRRVIAINKKRNNLSELVNTINNTKKIFFPMIRSRHPSHKGLRKQLTKLPFRSVIRFGSTTVLEDGHKRIELNSIESIQNSSSKIRMKNCFKQANVNTAPFIISNNRNEILEFARQHEFPIVKKSNFGSRGNGNTLIKNTEELERTLNDSNLSNYVFEKYCNYNKEYRLHVTKNGCFYSCRKMLKQEFKDHSNAWQRHDDNCVWILEQNENFDRPSNWNTIVEHCVKALKSCGLDFGACDLRVQNNIDREGNRRENPDFIVVEINSAPSFGEITLEKYKEILPNLLIQKYNER